MQRNEEIIITNERSFRMKTKFKAMMNRTLRVKDVLVMMMLPLMAMAIGGAVVMIQASKVKYDNSDSNLASTNVQHALDEIQMENPGISFPVANGGGIPKINQGANGGFFFDGGGQSVEFDELGNNGTVWIKGNFQVLDPETNEEVFSVDAKTGEVFGFISENVTTVSLQNGWSNYGQGFPPAGYWKDASGSVHLRGLIKGGDTTGGTVIFDLPEGYRTLWAGQHFLIASNHNVGEIFINDLGQVKVGFVDTTWVDLAGITFRTDQ